MVEMRVLAETRVCKVCNIEKPINEFRYGKRRGLEWICRECKNKRNREKWKNYSGVITVEEKRCTLCQEVKPASEFSINPLGKGGLNARCKKCIRQINRDLDRKKREDPIYRAKSYKRAREYKRKNRLKMYEYQRSWMISHPGYFRMRQRKLREGDLTFLLWLKIMAYYKFRCAYCGCTANLQIEHIIPISRGGKNTASNVVPACSRCNYRKSNRMIDEVGMKLIRPHPFPAIKEQ